MAKAWQNSDFGKRIDITIPSPDANLTAFPFPIILDGLSIVDTDIVDGEWCVYDGSDNLIPWDKEAYAEAASTCTGVLWTLVDQYVSPSSYQNHVYFYYNKVSGSTPGNTATDVWADYEAVYHLVDLADATGNGNTLSTLTNAPDSGGTGKIGSCYVFDDAVQENLASTLGSGDHAAGFPVWLEAWVKSDSLTAPQNAVWLGESTTTDDEFALALRGDAANDRCYAMCRNTTAFIFAATSASYTSGGWNHIVGHFTSTTARAAYIDGGNKGTDTGTSAFPDGTNRIGVGSLTDSSPAYFFSGSIDEVRVRLATPANTDEWAKHIFTVTDTGLTYAAIESKPAAAGLKAPIIGGGIL